MRQKYPVRNMRYTGAMSLAAGEITVLNEKRKNDFQLNKGCFNKQTVLALAFYSAEPFSVFIACPEGLLR